MSSSNVTQLLINWREGDKTALDKLMPIVYNELHRIANNYMRNQPSNHTLQSTALVNEAYLRLAESENLDLQNRTHFFAVAAQMMRQMLVNYAVARNTEKRGGGQFKLSLNEAIEVAQEQDWDIIALDDALKNLAVMDERKSQIIELRFFAGLSNEEIAEVMHLSLATVNRELRVAKAWLHGQIKASDIEP